MSLSFVPVGVTSGVVNATVINDNFDTLATLLADAEVTSASDFGSASISPDGDGNGTISHALGDTPDYATANLIGDTTDSVDVESVSSSNIVVRIKDVDGADVTSGTYTVHWLVKRDV